MYVGKLDGKAWKLIFVYSPLIQSSFNQYNKNQSRRSCKFVFSDLYIDGNSNITNFFAEFQPNKTKCPIHSYINILHDQASQFRQTETFKIPEHSFPILRRVLRIPLSSRMFNKKVYFPHSKCMFEIHHIIS